MLTRCDGEEQEEEGDEEGPENLLKGLTHQCSIALHVQGLPTGFCRDIHGQVCVCVWSELFKGVRKSLNICIVMEDYCPQRFHPCFVFSGGSVLEAETN